MNILQKKIKISTLLKFQLFYCILGIAYNLISYYIMISSGQALSANSPITGGVVMSFYGLCLYTGRKNFYKMYRLLMAFFLILLGYGGIIQHIIVYLQHPEAYSSFYAWISAVGVNLFGFILNLIATSDRFVK